MFQNSQISSNLSLGLPVGPKSVGKIQSLGSYEKLRRWLCHLPEGDAYTSLAQQVRILDRMRVVVAAV
jgi:hypothetical protein